jgi:hypothetical protein
MSRPIPPAAGCGLGTSDDPVRRARAFGAADDATVDRPGGRDFGGPLSHASRSGAYGAAGALRHGRAGRVLALHGRIDRSTYLRTTWYAGAYISESHQEHLFWSDLYKYVERCEERDGRDRCRETEYWVGVSDDLAEGESFSVDHKLTTGQLIATYPLRQRDSEGWVGRRRTVTVNATLTGLGETHRSEYSEEDWEGHCLVWGYEDRSVRREAVATGTLSGDVTRSLGRTRDAGLSTGRSALVERDC